MWLLQLVEQIGISEQGDHEGTWPSRSPSQEAKLGWWAWSLEALGDISWLEGVEIF